MLTQQKEIECANDEKKAPQPKKILLALTRDKDR